MNLENLKCLRLKKKKKLKRIKEYMASHSCEPATNQKGLLPPHQEQPSENSAYVRLQSGDAAGDRCDTFYLQDDTMIWHHSLKRKQVSSVRQGGLIITKYKLIVHKCAHFKGIDPEKAHVEKSRESSFDDQQKWAVADHQQSQG